MDNYEQLKELSQHIYQEHLMKVGMLLKHKLLVLNNYND